MVSPLGLGKEQFWEGLIESRSGIGKITLFDASSFPCQIAGEIKPADYALLLSEFLSKPERTRYSRCSKFATAAARMAIADAKLKIDVPERTDVIIGSSLFAQEFFEEELYINKVRFDKFEPHNQASPTAILRGQLSAPASHVSLLAGAQGYVTGVSTACTSGLNALGLGTERILDGHADVVICGGVDAPITRMVLSGLCSAKALSFENDNPQAALKPFDARRTRPLLAEGAGIFILEEAAHATSRNAAQIYCEVVGHAHANENTNMLFLIDKTGSKWAATMKKAINGKKIDLVNAHAPSDINLDSIELQALRQALGREAGDALITSIKGHIGSGFSAAGSLQIAASCLSLQTGIVPAVYNFSEPDPQCDLSIVKRCQKNKALNNLLIVSRSLDNNDVCITLQRWDR